MKTKDGTIKYMVLPNFTQLFIYEEDLLLGDLLLWSEDPLPTWHQFNPSIHKAFYQYRYLDQTHIKLKYISNIYKATKKMWQLKGYYKQYIILKKK